MSFKWYMGSLDPVNMLRVVKYNQDFRKQHPEFFDPEGIIVFCGMHPQCMSHHRSRYS